MRRPRIATPTARDDGFEGLSAIERFFKALVGRRWLIIMLALGVMVAGGFNLRQLAIDAVPDISPKQVVILTEATGLGPLEVERLVSIWKSLLP